MVELLLGTLWRPGSFALKGWSLVMTTVVRFRTGLRHRFAQLTSFNFVVALGTIGRSPIARSKSFRTRPVALATLVGARWNMTMTGRRYQGRFS